MQCEGGLGSVGKESSDSCDFEPDIDPQEPTGAGTQGWVWLWVLQPDNKHRSKKEPWQKYRYNKVTYRCRKWGVLGGWRYDWGAQAPGSARFELTGKSRQIFGAFGRYLVDSTELEDIWPLPVSWGVPCRCAVLRNCRMNWAECQLLDRTYYLMRRPTVRFGKYDSLKQKLFPQGQGEGNSRNADLSEVRIDGSRARRTAGIGATVTHCAGIAWGICMLLTIGLTLFCFTVDFVQMLESYSLTMGFFSQLSAT